MATKTKTRTGGARQSSTKSFSIRPRGGLKKSTAAKRTNGRRGNGKRAGGGATASRTRAKTAQRTRASGSSSRTGGQRARKRSTASR